MTLPGPERFAPFVGLREGHPALGPGPGWLVHDEASPALKLGPGSARTCAAGLKSVPALDPITGTRVAAGGVRHNRMAHGADRLSAFGYPPWVTRMIVLPDTRRPGANADGASASGRTAPMIGFSRPDRTRSARSASRNPSGATTKKTAPPSAGPTTRAPPLA